MNLIYLSILNLFLSEVSIGVSKVHVVEYKIEIFNLIDGVHENHYF